MVLPLPIPCHRPSPEFGAPILNDEDAPKTIEEAMTDILNSGHQRIADYWGSTAVQASVALEIALEVYPELFTESMT